jgi:ribosomal protein L9
VRLSNDLSDIHQSNNVRNATQERLQVSSEEHETHDMECQTRESLFDSSLILKSSSHSAFTTFGLQTVKLLILFLI